MLQPLLTALLVLGLAAVTRLWREGALSDGWFVRLGAPGLIALAVLVSPLYQYWMELVRDETGWFFIIELFVTLLVLPLTIGLGYVGYALVVAGYRILRRDRPRQTEM